MAKDPLKTRVTEMLGCEFPIFAFTHCKDVAAAVTNAGGVGVLGLLGADAQQIDEDARWLKEKCGDKPWGIDLVFPASVPAKTMGIEELEAQIPQEHRDFIESIFRDNNIPKPKQPPLRPGGLGGGFISQEAQRKQLDAVVSNAPPLFVSGLGNPSFAVEALHGVGTKVGGLVGKVRQARREMEGGVDLIMAQGYDAGGHTGEIGTFTLIPRIVQAAKEFGTPVLAAGGIGTGAHVAAALALGAEGVWAGSIWLASRESDASIAIKEKLIASSEEDTIRARVLTGKPARMLRTKYTEAWEAPNAPTPLPMPLQSLLIGELQRGIMEADMDEWQGTPAGQMVGNIESMKPCSEIVFDLVSEARDVLESLGVESPA